ncbi:MAG TPA: nucleoside hydrolase [Thermoanaerobaculia bacterium]|nr:nucleoside hydrolase [Thermoanaerobaculia bacterium]
MIASFVAAAALAQTRVIVSTDMAMGLAGGWRATDDVDDGWAVAMALADRKLDVRLVATVLGNSNVAPEQIATDALLRVLKSPMRRARGAAVALDVVPATLNGKLLPHDCVNDATAAMQQVLARGRATIVAIGPLTDVACVARNAPPRVVANIDRVIAIMGRSPNEAFAIGPKNVPVTDFNVVMDPNAVAFLLKETKIPMTFLQFGLTRQVLISRDFVRSLEHGTRLQQYFYKSSIPFVEFWSSKLGEDGFHPWDSAAVYYAAHRSAFQCSSVGFELVSCASTVQPDPYNRFGQCAGHSVNQSTTLDRESVQLWLGPDYATRKVTACTGYSDGGKEAFEKAAVVFLTPP